MEKQHTVGRLWERQPSAQQQMLLAGLNWSEGSDTPPRVLGAGEGTAPALGPGTAGEDRARARPANRPRNAHFRGPPAAPSRAHTSETSWGWSCCGRPRREQRYSCSLEGRSWAWLWQLRSVLGLISRAFGKPLPIRAFLIGFQASLLKFRNPASLRDRTGAMGHFPGGGLGSGSALSLSALRDRAPERQKIQPQDNIRREEN